MAVTIDSLELKITHDSGEAISALDKLIATLEKLKTASAMGGELSTVARGIRAIEAAANNNPKKGLEKGLKEVANAAKEAKNGIEEVTQAAERAMGSVPFQDFSQGGTTFDYQSPPDVYLQGSDAERAAQSFLAFSESYDNGMERIAEANLKGKAASEAMKAVLQEATAAADSATSATQSTYGGVEEDVSGMDAALSSAGDKLREANEEIRSLKESIYELDQELMEASDSFSDVDDDVEELDDELEDLDEDIDDVNDSIDDHVTYVRRVGHAYKGATTGLDKFLSTVKRLVIMRAIRAAIREVAKGFSEGTENLYRYSEAMNSTDSANAKNSLDSVATSLLYLKNSVGAAVAPLIQSLVPVLQTVVNWAVQAANAINMFISALQGKTMYTRAKESAETMFDGIKSSAGGAAKAAKEAKATLLAFDEINRLDSADKGSGGGGGGSSSSIPDYGSMFEEALIDLPQWMQWIKDHLEDILPMVRDIGLALASWYIANGVISGINNIVSAFQTMSALQKGLAGLILITLGVVWSFQGGYDIGRGTADLLDYIKTGLGILAAGVGGALIGSAIAPGIGTGIGFAIGITIGLVATLVGVFEGKHQRLVDDFYNSEVGKSLNAHSERSKMILEQVAELRLDVDSITGEIDTKTMGKLTKAKDLIKEIFDLDEKENKTSAEMSILKEKVEELNSLNINGLRLEFDDTGKKVKGTREEVEKLYNKILEETRLEAARESLKKIWQDQYELGLQLADAQDNYNGLLEDQKKVENELQPYLDRVNKANQKKLELEEKYKDMLPQVRNEQQDYRDAVSELEFATKDLDNAQSVWKVHQDEANKKVTEGKQALDEAQDAYDAATKKAEKLEDAVYDLAKANDTANKSFSETETSLKYSEGATDTYKEIQEAAQKAAKAVGGINNQDMTSVHKQLQMVKGDLEALAKKYTVKFEYPKGVTGATGYYGQGTMRASGGFPSRGELFIAGEQQPELVGSINGRTAVVSGGEISGISAAVYATGEREVAAINNLIRALNQKDMTAVVSTDSIVSGLARKNRRDGVSTVPVSV